jgi:dTDP-glucose 4,6-dehydratase/UDP-glucose 4,6-dehydratase
MSSVSKDYTPSVLLVTGGCGFIGSNFINRYHAENPDVKIVNVDRVDYCAAETNVENQHHSWYAFFKADITDTAAMRGILENWRPDAIVHFAAQSHVDNSFGNSLTFTHDNVVGTHTLLECCRTVLGPHLKRFVHISTDEVYGEVSLDHPGCTEASLLNPTNPYAASKAAAEFLVRSYNHSYGLPTIITRGNNVYGPYQYPEKIVPRFIDLLLKGEHMTIHGSGESRRNFIHVFDVAAAVGTILRRGEIAQIYNIGGDCELSVLEVARRLLGILKPGEKLENWITVVPDRLFNDKRYAVKNDALVALGWSPTIPFEQGLAATAVWYAQTFTKRS